MNRILAMVAFLMVSGSGALGFSKGLALDTLIKSALKNNLDLKVMVDEGDLLSSDTLGVFLKNNPELEVEAGYNFNHPNEPKISARISKEFQRSMNIARQDLAQSRLVAKKNWENWNRQELIFEIKDQFFKWQIISQKKLLQIEVEKKWNSLARIAITKVKEGRLSEIESAEAELNSAKARQKKLQFESDLESVEKKLARLTGISFENDVTISLILIDSLPSLPPLQTLHSISTQKNLELKALEKEIQAEENQIQFEKALRHPPLTLSVGYDREPDGNALLAAGFSLPLPIYNRNQVGIDKSQRALNLSQSKKRVAENHIQSEISDAYAKISRLALQYHSHQNEILRLGKKQMDLSEKGFIQGLLGIFELSKIQEEYLAQEMEGLDLASNFYEEWNRLALITGESL